LPTAADIPVNARVPALAIVWDTVVDSVPAAAVLVVVGLVLSSLVMLGSLLSGF